MKVNTSTIHVHVRTSSKDTAVNGMSDSGQLDGIVIFDTKSEGYPSVYIRWEDDDMRRQLLYSLMTSEELERFTSR